MLDAFERTPGQVYPSWQENPKLVRERAVRTLRITAVLADKPWLPAGVMIQRTGNARYEIFENGKRILTTSDGARNGQIEQSIQQVLEYFETYDVEEPVNGDVKLSEKSLACLRDLAKRDGAVNPKVLPQYQGNLIATLRKKKLIAEVPDGIVITPKGLDELAARGSEARGDQASVEAHDEAPVAAAAKVAPLSSGLQANNPVKFTHEPDPTRAVQTAVQTVRTAVSATIEAEIPNVPNEVVPTSGWAAAAEDICPDCPANGACLHRRVLDYLMSQSPPIRAVFEHMAGLEGAMHKIRSLDDQPVER